MVKNNNFNSVILDIVARYGIHPSFKNFDGENIILLVEADKIEADRLRKRYKNFKNVKVYAQAIGEIVGYKNLRILKNPAMSGFFRRKKNFTIILGSKKISRKINNIESNNFPNLYKYSQLYIFSSYCEVFGLTSLEAMTQGCPVLISNTSALPEINSIASDYFDPDNIIDIKNKIKKILIDENHKSNLIKNGKDHIKKFTWHNNVEKTLEIISD